MTDNNNTQLEEQLEEVLANLNQETLDSISKQAGQGAVGTIKDIIANSNPAVYSSKIVEYVTDENGEIGEVSFRSDDGSFTLDSWKDGVTVRISTELINTNMAFINEFKENMDKSRRSSLKQSINYAMKYGYPGKEQDDSEDDVRDKMEAHLVRGSLLGTIRMIANNKTESISDLSMQSEDYVGDAMFFLFGAMKGGYFHREDGLFSPNSYPVFSMDSEANEHGDEHNRSKWFVSHRVISNGKGDNVKYYSVTQHLELAEEKYESVVNLNLETVFVIKKYDLIGPKNNDNGVALFDVKKADEFANDIRVVYNEMERGFDVPNTASVVRYEDAKGEVTTKVLSHGVIVNMVGYSLLEVYDTPESIAELKVKGNRWLNILMSSITRDIWETSDASSNHKYILNVKSNVVRDVSFANNMTSYDISLDTGDFVSDGMMDKARIVLMMHRDSRNSDNDHITLIHQSNVFKLNR